MTEKILAVVNRLTVTPATFETPLDALGLDSLEFVELLAEVEEKSGVRVPPEAAAAFDTIGDLARYVERHQC